MWPHGGTAPYANTDRGKYACKREKPISHSFSFIKQNNLIMQPIKLIRIIIHSNDTYALLLFRFHLWEIDAAHAVIISPINSLIIHVLHVRHKYCLQHWKFSYKKRQGGVFLLLVVLCLYSWLNGFTQKYVKGRLHFSFPFRTKNFYRNPITKRLHFLWNCTKSILIIILIQ